MRRLIRWLLGGFFAVALLLVLAVGGLWWWAGTEGSLQWALGQLSARQPVVVEGARGSLRTGVQAQRLAWQQDGLSVEATGVQLAWQPLALLQGTLRLDHLRAATVRVEDRGPPKERKPPPQSLALPLRVVVEDLSVGRFTWVGKTPVEANELSARYAYDGAAHQLALRGLRMFDGHYRGDVRLGARGELPLDASLQGRIAAPVPGGAQAVPLLFEVQLDGPLTHLQARAQLQAEGGGVVSSDTRATVTAQLTPWAAVPVTQGRATLQAVDVGALWPQAPRTALAGTLSFEPAGTDTWTLTADLRNSLPGPWDRKRLPAERLRLAGDWRLSGQALVRELDARLGGGRIEGQGQWDASGGWTVNTTLVGVNPAALHTAMAPMPVGGKASARGEGQTIHFDVALRAADPGRPAAAAKPSETNELAAAAGALELRELNARGRWAGRLLALSQLSVRTSDASLEAAIDADLKDRTGQGRAVLQAPGMQVRAAGAVGAKTGGGTVRLGAADLAQAQRWLARLPYMPEAVSAQPVSGRADLQLAWQGGWLDPSVQGSLTLPMLELVPTTEGAVPWVVRDTTARLDGRLADARLELRGGAQSGVRRLNIELSGRGGRRDATTWQAQVSALQLAVSDPAIGPGAWRLALRRSFDLRWAAGNLDVGSGDAALIAPSRPGTATAAGSAEALLAWEPVRWGGGQLRSAGRLTGLPMAWVELAGGPQLAGSALAGDLVFDAQWQVELGQALRVRASLVRSGGDLTVLAENAGGGTTRVQAGVREARLLVEGDGDAVNATLAWDSERAGNAQARLATRLSRGAEGGWQWAPDAPLTGTVRAQLPRLGVWSVLAPPGWRLRGSLAADIAVAGTRAAPGLSGTVRADDLALRSVVDGIELQGGRLRARLDGQRLLVDEFLLRGGGGEGGGTLTASGEGSWAAGAPQVTVTAQLQRLRAGIRADRELTVSGQVQARMDAGGAAVNGRLRVDRALIVLPDEAAPQLGSDVVVRNAPGAVPMRAQAKAPDATTPPARPVSLAVDLDLGDDFRVRGRGIETRLAGTLAVAGQNLAQPRLTGVINTVGGEYRAYGQRLDIERGVLRFTGAPDNPALDVLAVRPRLVQKVGVLVTGRAQAPFVRLYSEPELPEAEKLSWLILGRASAAGGAEAALLQQAAAAIFASRTGAGGGGKGPAALLGLDEVGFRRDGEAGPAVTLGKRLGQNLYASYERSLSGALGTLYLFYDLSRRLTVRAQAGDRAAVDLIFTFAYD
jgi:translocation and assembly module TamB